jgi:hypothetical protein
LLISTKKSQIHGPTRTLSSGLNGTKIACAIVNKLRVLKFVQPEKSGTMVSGLRFLFFAKPDEMVSILLYTSLDQEFSNYELKSE